MIRKINRVLERALLEGGSILSRAFFLPKEIKYKGVANLVTQTDKTAENKIIGIIKRAFPSHLILAEESDTTGLYQPSRQTPFKWIIDPLDGTTNFAHDLPIASVSIAVESYGSVILGGVWNPFSKEMFWAEKRKGAYLNGKRIRVSKANDLKRSLLVTGFPYDRTIYAHRYLKVMEAFMQITHGIRRLGSAALDLCFVAAGRFDGYWETKLHPWDQAAGVLIVQEAGGKTTDFFGNPIDIYAKQTLASNGKIHAQMVRIIKKFKHEVIHYQ